jgi:hypothetical protein
VARLHAPAAHPDKGAKEVTMRTFRLLALGALLMGASAGAAQAANPHQRSGFFIGFNLGAGTADISSDEFGDTDREWGGAGNFRLAVPSSRIS